jgi:adenylate kinase family enzyme
LIERGRIKIALVTGPSGSGKSFVVDQLRGDFECLSYDRLMRDSIEQAFPNHIGDKWDKQIWLDNSRWLDLVAAFTTAFAWTGTRPLVVEGWQLRETVWREAILNLAAMRARVPVTPKLFLIRPILELLLSQRETSKHEYHRRNANLADCKEQIARHEKLYREQPWHGELAMLQTKRCRGRGGLLLKT